MLANIDTEMPKKIRNMIFRFITLLFVGFWGSPRPDEGAKSPGRPA